MAITKVYAVRNHLHRIVSYATNEQKTELNGIIEYAVNPDKTEKRLFECAINCRSVITAYDEMQSTKSRWKLTKVYSSTDIEADTITISEKLHQTEEITAKDQKIKEEHYEHKWRGSRFDG